MMNVEEEIFAKRQCRFNKLAAYGFKKNGDDYYLEVPLKSANFLAKIIVSSVGKVSGNVYDLDTGDEYLLLRVESDTGSFSAVVKAEYRALLQDVADKCFNASSKPRQTRSRMKLRPATVVSQIFHLRNSQTTPSSEIPRTGNGMAC
ncbi:hypothetical protein [Lactobacillus delbrueckii]|uniref:hypothetical protein n=1 Tax=Lactobacillus delbrueckii TaxID=1584 RepID=UPI0030CEBAD4